MLVGRDTAEHSTTVLHGPSENGSNMNSKVLYSTAGDSLSSCVTICDGPDKHDRRKCESSKATMMYACNDQDDMMI